MVNQLMKDSHLLSELGQQKTYIVDRINHLKKYLTSLDAVIEMCTPVSPREICWRAIQNQPEKIWTGKLLANALVSFVQSAGVLDRKVEKAEKHCALILVSLCKEGLIERVDRGKYKKFVERPIPKDAEPDSDDIVTALVEVPKKSTLKKGQQKKYAGLVPYDEMEIGHSIFLDQKGSREQFVMQTCIRAEASRQGCKITTQREKSGLNVIIIGKIAGATNNGKSEINRQVPAISAGEPSQPNDKLMHCYYCKGAVRDNQDSKCPHCKKPKVLVK